MGVPLPTGPTSVPRPTNDSGPIGRVESRLLSLDAGIRSAARHSYRLSWFAWGFLFAAFVGIPVVEVAFIFAALRSTGGTTSVGVIGIGAIPAVVLFALVLRELRLGRQEAHRFREGTGPTPPPAEVEPVGLSLLTVQEDQKEISRVRGELEVSMVPLILGGIGLIEFVDALVIVTLYPGFGSLSVVYLPVIPLVIIVPLIWAIWRAARQWVGQYQKGLDDQVREMVSLEGEFLGRFASGPSGK
jgi:hypothetical protein